MLYVSLFVMCCVCEFVAACCYWLIVLVGVSVDLRVLVVCFDVVCRGYILVCCITFIVYLLLGGLSVGLVIWLGLGFGGGLCCLFVVCAWVL